MNVFDEFFKIVRVLEERGVRYALVGGVAMAFYTEPRFTRDIDFLISADDFSEMQKALEDFGYVESITPWTFQEISITLHRFFKVEEDEEMMIDVLASGDPEVDRFVESAVDAESDQGRVRVVRREDLVELKRIRASGQDLVDIERLESEED